MAFTHLLGMLTAAPLTGLPTMLLTPPAIIRGWLMASLQFLWCTRLVSMVSVSLLWFRIL